MENKNISVNVKVWRQKNSATKGGFETYTVDDVNPDMSILEMLDVLNEDLIVKGVEPVTGKRPDNVDVYGDMTKGQYATLQDMAKRCGNLYRFGLWGRNGGEPENPNADPVKAKAAKASTGLAKVAKPTKGEGTKGRQAEYVKAVYALNVAYWGQGAADGDKAPSLERSNVWRERAASNKRRAKAKVAKA